MDHPESGISLISPNTLHQKYRGSLKSFMFEFNFYFIGKVAPSLVQGEGGKGGMEVGGEGDYTVTTRMTPALRWAGTRAI